MWPGRRGAVQRCGSMGATGGDRSILEAKMHLLLLALATGTAGEGWDRLRDVWSVEVGPTFAIRGDLSGNVRDIPRAYAAADVAGDLPLGGGLFFRSILRYPTGGVEPAWLFRVEYDQAASGGIFRDYGEYARRSSGLTLSTGLGACLPTNTCVFAAYSYRHVRTSDDNYPITNIEAVLGNPDGASIDAFTPPYLERILIPGILAIIDTVDFDSQRIRVDLSDRSPMHGAQLAMIGGMGQRVTIDGAFGGYSLVQSHSMTARVNKDIEDPDGETEPFSYTYDKPMAAIGFDLGLSVGVLPTAMPVQLAVGIRGSSVTLLDMSVDRTIGGYLNGGVFLSAKW